MRTALRTPGTSGPLREAKPTGTGCRGRATVKLLGLFLCLAFTGCAGRFTAAPGVPRRPLPRASTEDFAKALEAGDLNRVRKLLAAEPRLARRAIYGTCGMSPLHVAAEKGYVQVAALLLQHGARVNTESFLNIRPLHLAGGEGHLDMVKLLVRHGACVDAEAEAGCTVLHWAVCEGRLDVVRFLVEHGADPSLRNERGETALRAAAARGHLDVVRFLVKHPNGLNDEELLACAVASGDKTLVSSELTRVFGPKPPIKRLNDLLGLVAEDGKDEVARFLLEKGAEPTLESAVWLGLTERVAKALEANPACTKRGLLELAVRHNRVEITRLLLAQGVKPRHAGTTELHLAADDGHAAVVRLLLGAGAPVDATDEDQSTPLALAAGSGHSEAARLLLDAGAPMNALDLYGMTPLGRAAGRGRTEVAALLLARGADPDRAKWASRSPLAKAAEAGDLAMLRLLIAKGASIEKSGRAAMESALAVALRKKSQEHRDAAALLARAGARLPPETRELHIAAGRGDLRAVRFALDYGAGVANKHYEGNTPLHKAAAEGHRHVCRLLLQRGADLEATNNNHLTPLGLAARRSQYALAKWLINKGAKVDLWSAACLGRLTLAENWPDVLAKTETLNASDGQHETPLSLAVTHGRADTVKALLALGARPKPESISAWRLIVRAAARGHRDVIEVLIAAGVKPRLVFRDEFCVKGWEDGWEDEGENSQTVRLLVEAGADVNATDDRGTTLLSYACQEPRPHGMKRVAFLLLDAGANPRLRDRSRMTPLHYAAFCHQADDLVEELLDRGADPDARDDTGQTPLFYTALYPGQAAAAEVLIAAGADVNAKADGGGTPLHALRAEQRWLAKILIKHGADVNARDDRGATPLHAAVSGFDIVGPSAAAVLLAAGADVNAKDKKGCTPLHYAAKEENGPWEAVLLLLDHGADIRAKDRKGRTPLEAGTPGFAIAVEDYLAKR